MLDEVHTKLNCPQEFASITYFPPWMSQLEIVLPIGILPFAIKHFRIGKLWQIDNLIHLY